MNEIAGKPGIGDVFFPVGHEALEQFDPHRLVDHGASAGEFAEAYADSAAGGRPGILLKHDAYGVGELAILDVIDILGHFNLGRAVFNAWRRDVGGVGLGAACGAGGDFGLELIAEVA